MNCNNITDEMFDAIVQSKVWKEISECSELTAELVDHYADQLDWKKLSENGYVQWTPEIVEHYADRINWDDFSRCVDEEFLTSDNLAHFADRWNWSELSGRYHFDLSYEVIDRFIDRWDWAELIDTRRDNDIFSREFYVRYRDHIPLDEFFFQSTLINDIVEDERVRLEKEMGIREE